MANTVYLCIIFNFTLLNFKVNNLNYFFCLLMYMDTVSKEILKKIGVVFTEINQLDGTTIYRDDLLCHEKYNEIQKMIPEIKHTFSSSFMTSIHDNACEKQRWPLINLIRQILKNYHYNMVPKKVSNGYDKDGKKKFIRLFTIQKQETTKTKV